MNKSDQTKKSFADKWENTPNLLFDLEEMSRSGILDWILSRNGFDAAAEFAVFLKDKSRILDAGCGNGRITRFINSLTDNKITGVDFNIETAKNNLEKITNIEVIEADLMKPLSHLGKYNFIYCQEVLHHTSVPKSAFRNLVDILEKDGIIAIYVYKEKGPIREFTDDYIRERISSLNYEESFEVAKSLAQLGKSLSQIEEQISVANIPVLGIKEGAYNIHSFIYNYFLKCWFNKEIDIEQSVAVNLDWFHPELCSRHTLDEVREWLISSNLKIIHECEDEYGITVHGIKS